MINEYSRYLEEKWKRDYGTVGVLASSHNEKTKVKDNSPISGEWEEWKLGDKERRNPVV